MLAGLSLAIQLAGSCLKGNNLSAIAPDMCIEKVRQATK